VLFNSASASSPSLESNPGWIGNFLQFTGLMLPIPSEIHTLCRQSEKLLSVYPKNAAIEKFKKQFKACDSNYKNCFEIGVNSSSTSWKIARSNDSSVNRWIVPEIWRLEGKHIAQGAEDALLESSGSKTSHVLLYVLRN
jgi:hypothetical protein